MSRFVPLSLLCILIKIEQEKIASSLLLERVVASGDQAKELVKVLKILEYSSLHIYHSCITYGKTAQDGFFASMARYAQVQMCIYFMLLYT